MQWLLFAIEIPFSHDDCFYRAEKSGNQEFIDQLSRWTFQEKSVLKVHDHRHHKDGDTHKADSYRIKDDIVSASTKNTLYFNWFLTITFLL